MGKGKLAKFAEMAENPLVVECPYSALPREGEFPLRGHWHADFFHNSHPIVLELGCGRGEYTVGLGRMRPDKNYIGVDIKGARMWTGAREALESGMTNVGFLRTQIEFIDRFFAPGEVSEIWLTFSDPQMKKATKRLTSTYFLQRYRRFTVEMLRANSIPTLACTDNLYGTSLEADTLLHDAAAIQTYYEQMWRQRGIDIKYLCFRLPQEGNLVESDVEIPLDDYRSYCRAKRSSKETGK